MLDTLAYGGRMEAKRRKQDMADWLTNSPEAAAALRKADRIYAAAKRAATYLPLAQKIEALRAARLECNRAYEEVERKA